MLQVDHVGLFSLGTCAYFIIFYRESCSETMGAQIVLLVVVAPFS